MRKTKLMRMTIGKWERQQNRNMIKNTVIKAEGENVGEELRGREARLTCSLEIRLHCSSLARVGVASRRFLVAPTGEAPGAPEPQR